MRRREWDAADQTADTTKPIVGRTSDLEQNACVLGPNGVIANAIGQTHTGNPVACGKYEGTFEADFDNG